MSAVRGRKPAAAAPGHECVVCRTLPIRPSDPVVIEDGVEFRPKKPRPTTSGGPRSRVCRTHERAKSAATKFAARTGQKAKAYGVSRAVQVALWDYQGRSCPCGRKRSEKIPPGVALHHDRVLARLHDHPDEQGCLECVVVFLCMSCNRDVIGRLERTYAADYQRIAFALLNLSTVIVDRPLARLLAERPDLLEQAS